MRGTFAVAYFETTARVLPAAIAVFAYRLADQLREHRLGEPADLRVAGHHGGQRAAIATYNEVAVALFEFCEPAQLVEHGDRRFEPLVYTTCRWCYLVRYAASHRLQ